MEIDGARTVEHEYAVALIALLEGRRPGRPGGVDDEAMPPHHRRRRQAACARNARVLIRLARHSGEQRVAGRTSRMSRTRSRSSPRAHKRLARHATTTRGRFTPRDFRD